MPNRLRPLRVRPDRLAARGPRRHNCHPLLSFRLEVQMNRHTLIGAISFVGLAALGIQQGAAPRPIKFARNPHIANDGRIAFNYQDDIWVADADGGNARRLTANVARDFGPRFSPDGQWIAFTSNRTGNNDVYVIPSNGVGEAKQLTWFSGDDQALYWTPDGKQLIIASARGPVAFNSPLY